MSFTFPVMFRRWVVLVTQGARQEMKPRICVWRLWSPLPAAGSASRDRGRQLDAQVLFTAAWGRKQADVNEGWRFHEAQLVDGRFNVTGLNWAMIRTVCKIHFLAGLCPPAPSSTRSSPSPSSYAFECNKNWTMLCCPRFHLTTIAFWIKEGRKKNNPFFFMSPVWFPPPVLILLQSKRSCLLRAEGAPLKATCMNVFAAPTMSTPAPIYRRFPGMCRERRAFPCDVSGEWYEFAVSQFALPRSY